MNATNSLDRYSDSFTIFILYKTWIPIYLIRVWREMTFYEENKLMVIWIQPMVAFPYKIYHWVYLNVYINEH